MSPDTACVDVQDWKSSRGFTCNDHASGTKGSGALCTKEGKETDGFKQLTDDATFADFKDEATGQDATQACCACGGGTVAIGSKVERKCPATAATLNDMVAKGFTCP